VSALRLGRRLVDRALADSLPVVIDIRTGTRTLFHAALPGASPMNDLWALRKGNLALAFQAASMLVTLRFRANGRSVEGEGLNPATHVLSGGAVPIVVRGTGMVAVCTVSGLPEEADHALVVAAIRGGLVQS